MGCSMGGRLAIDFALAHPSRVSALVLVACSVSGAPVDSNGPFEPVVQALVDRLEAAEARGDLATLNELEAQAWLDGPAQPAGRVSGPARDLFLSMNGIALASAPTGEVIEPLAAWDRLAEIEVPTLVVWGTYDFAHFGPRMREVAKRIAGSRTIEMEAVAHLPNLERPLEFNRAVAQFLVG
jgi:pimeloyl-ACP methyl ester carboxylesterase